MMSLYEGFNDKRYEEMHPQELVDMCKVKPRVAIYLLKCKPQLFGGFDPCLLRRAQKIGAEDNVKFYKGYYMHEVSKINESTNELVNSLYSDKVHYTYKKESKRSSLCCLI